MKLEIEMLGEEIGVILPQESVNRPNFLQDASFLDAEILGNGLRFFFHGSLSNQSTPGATEDADE